jgi:hypothetical protein
MNYKIYFSEKETAEDPVKAAENEIKEIKEILPDMRQKVYYLVNKYFFLYFPLLKGNM